MNTIELFKRINFWAICALFAGLTFSSALVEIAFGFAIISWIIWKAADKSLWKPVCPPKVLIPLAAYVLIILCSYFWSEIPHQSGRGILKVLQQIATFWIAADIMQIKSNQKTLWRFFVVLIVIVLLDCAFQYFFGRDLIRGFQGEPASSGIRLSGAFASYGLLATFMIVTIPLMTALTYRYYLFRGWSRETFFHLFLTLGGLTVLFLTRSRGAFLAFGGGGLIFMLLKGKYKWILGVAAVAVLLFLILPRGMIIHLDAEGKEQSIIERYYLWDRAIHVIKAKPLTGMGINTYAAAHAKYDVTKNWRVRNYYAHNGYLQMAAETGLVSLLAFLLWIFRFFTDGLKCFKRHPRSEIDCIFFGLLIGAVNFLLLTLVDTVFHNNQAITLFWLWLGFLTAYIRRYAGKV